MRFRQVVVIGSSNSSSKENDASYKIGKAIAQYGFVLITGGRGGVMEQASRGAKEAGGLVVGILPGESFDGANPFCDVVIPTGIGYARNSVNVLAADLIISVGGSAGTLSEIAYAWNYNKKIVACAYTGGWSGKLAGESLDMRRADTVIPALCHEDVLYHLKRLHAVS